MKSMTVVVNLSVRRRLVEVDSCWEVDNYLVNSCLAVVVGDSYWLREVQVELDSCQLVALDNCQQAVVDSCCCCCNNVVGKDNWD